MAAMVGNGSGERRTEKEKIYAGKRRRKSGGRAGLTREEDGGSSESRGRGLEGRYRRCRYMLQSLLYAVVGASVSLDEENRQQ